MAIGPSFPGVLAAAQEGVEWAWRLLFEEMAPALNGYAYARGVRDHEDLVADVFAELAGRIGSFAGDERGFRSWAFMIAHSRLVDHHRRARRNRIVGMPDGFDLASPEGDRAALIDRRIDPELAAALRALTADQLTTVLLRIVAGLNLEETAQVMNRNVNAVKQIQFRAMRILRREMSRKAVTK